MKKDFYIYERGHPGYIGRIKSTSKAKAVKEWLEWKGITTPICGYYAREVKKIETFNR